MLWWPMGGKEREGDRGKGGGGGGEGKSKAARRVSLFFHLAIYILQSAKLIPCSYL